MNRQIFGKNSKTVGVAPSVVLINPKYSRNVSQVVRACSCFGIQQCWFTGDFRCDTCKRDFYRGFNRKDYPMR